MKLKIAIVIAIFISSLQAVLTDDKVVLIQTLNQLSKPVASITWQNVKADLFSVYFIKKSGIYGVENNYEERRNYTKPQALITLDFNAEYSFVTTHMENGSESARNEPIWLQTAATPIPVAKSSTTAEVLMLDFPNAKYHELVVFKLPSFNITKTSQVNTTELLLDVKNNQKVRYVTLIIDNLVKEQVFVVGNNSLFTYNNIAYCNFALEPNTKYMFFQRTYLNDTEYFSYDWMTVIQTKPLQQNKKLTETEIALLSVGIIIGIVLLVIAIACFLYYHNSCKSNGLKEKRSRSDLSDIFDKDLDLQRKATITSIEHIPNMKFSSLQSFIDRFSPNLNDSVGFRTNSAKKFSTISSLTYDEFKVHAKINDIYKNATFIPGFVTEKDYIVLLSLLDEEVELLWKMVWENNINQIVMIGPFKENKSPLCVQYLPTEDSQMVHNVYNVSVVKVYKSANMVFRTISLKFGETSRIVNHYQFLSWRSDQITPTHPSIFIQFVLSIIKETTNQNSGPLVVHSASSRGCANVYTCVDAQMRRIVERNDVNIHSNVLKIRNQIKSIEEFIFVHDCILEFIRIRSFEDIPIENLSTYVEKIKKEVADSPFNSEFNFILKNFSTNQKTLVANLDSNKKQNSDGCFKPFDYNRVKLKKLLNSETSDYVNASFIDTFSKKKAYVVTPTPNASMVEMFWQMIVETNSWIIVIFNEEYKEDKKIEKFLPNEGTGFAFGDFSLKLVSEQCDNDRDVVLRCIKLTNKAGEDQLVMFYQYLTWPKCENVSFESMSSLLNFIQETDVWRKKLSAKRVALVSSLEDRQPGVFVALKSIAEEIESTGKVNIFRTVYTLRQQRLGMIQTRADYALIYTCALELTKRLKRTNESSGVKGEQSLTGSEQNHFSPKENTFASLTSLSNSIGQTNLAFNNEENPSVLM